MKVRTKLSLALGLPLLLLLGSLVYHVRTVRQSVSTSFELSALSDRLFLSSSTQSSLLNQLEENAEKFWITRDPGYLIRFQELRDAFRSSLETLAVLDLTSAEAAQVRQLAAAWDGFGPIADAIENGPPVDGDTLTSDGLAVLRMQLSDLRWQVRQISDVSQRVMADRLEVSAARAVRGEQFALGAAAVSILLSLAISILLIRSISGTLGRLKAGTRAVAEGDFEHRLPAASGDEFADLARDFNVMTRRLGELDRTKKHFLSSVSHDLKTPLASMQETTKILLDEVPGSLTSGQRHLLELSHQSGRRLSSMIADLLDLSSMEAGAFSLQRQVHEIGQIVRQAVEQMQPLAAERRVRLAMELPERRLDVDCDAARVGQVLVNLLSNAIKFAPANSEVVVSVHRFSDGEAEADPQSNRNSRGAGQVVARTRDSAVLCVTDQGPGIPSQEREIVFHRFVQTETGRAAPGKGVGLGLAICREIVAAHGGRIWVEDGLQGGSRFVMLLPDALPSATAAPLISAATAAHT